MRNLIVAAAALATACSATATVKRQSPIANLQTHRVVAVRVDAEGAGRSWTRELEAAVVQKVGGKCKFDSVLPAEQLGGTAPDLVVDLNIQRVFRGGDGLIQNPNKVIMDVLIVLSDGAGDELLGSAWIRGESPSVQVSGKIPERQAVGVVADSVAKLLDLSGCALARVEPEPEPEPQPQPDPPGVDPETIAQAEAANDEGKKLFKAAKIDAAVGKFREAIALVPDPRFHFNLCFSLEALKRYDEALAACDATLKAEPDERLRKKTTDRIQGIQKKKAANE
jgi:hypothetical protein